MEKTHGQQIRQGADLTWEASTLDQREVTWHFKKNEKYGHLKSLYLHFHKTQQLNLTVC